MIRPLAGRVLIKPDAQAKETASGLAIPDSHFEYEMSGRVVMVGDGPASAHNVRKATLRSVLKVIDRVAVGRVFCTELLAVKADVQQKLAVADSLAEVKEGDRVAFPYTAGTVMDVDGQRYLLMNEDQIVAVLEAE